MPETILELDAVSKRFGATVTADQLSLGIDKGAFVTFLGPSGSGKSTILRIIAGLEAPDGGTVRIRGRDMAGVAPWDRNLGMVSSGSMRSFSTRGFCMPPTMFTMS